ncbi:Hypothetical predicted protein [Octopus vulgaris]|uniref:Uncharacterized protein n=1 Tax=Octopus vulgaris TaxID=6645 RepID=A0AA36B8T8_OCTVU|nr:Hypothetical predicted protein [Octopus vulgaris]
MPSGEDSAKLISSYSGASGNEPHWITQEDLNDLARDLYLSKQQSELLVSRLKHWTLVKADTCATFPPKLKNNMGLAIDGTEFVAVQNAKGQKSLKHDIHIYSQEKKQKL